MKTLYLVRHAKSEKGFKNISDFDRPLNERGIHDANTIAQILSAKKEVPEIIITSPATRALSTALIFSRELDLDIEKIILKNEIYEASENDLIKLIGETPDSYSSIMLFGHNPTFTEICNHYITARIENMPTSSVIRIDFHLNSWKESPAKKGTLVFFETPKHAHEAQ